jgi:hypothetical protein
MKVIIKKESPNGLHRRPEPHWEASRAVLRASWAVSRGVLGRPGAPWGALRPTKATWGVMGGAFWVCWVGPCGAAWSIKWMQEVETVEKALVL